MDTLKTYLKSQIDRAAQAASPATLEVHKAKLDEARDVLDRAEVEGREAIAGMAADAVVMAYPTLAASIGLDGENLLEVAEKVHAAGMASRQRITAVERTRLTAKRAIDAAQTKEECEAAFLAVSWN